MNSQDKRSGNRGAQPKGDLKRVPITIYRTIKDINLVGGIENVRERLGNYFDDDVYDTKKITPSNKEVKQIVKDI